MDALLHISDICRKPVRVDKKFYRLLVVIILVGLGGCATTEKVQLTRNDTPVKLLVLQSPLSIDTERLQKVLAPNSATQLSLSDEPLAHGVEHAQDYASAAMRSALKKLPGVDVVTAPTAEEQHIDSVWKYGLSRQEADQIRAMTGADALLRFSITDYGLTPKSWRKGYITFEITTTLGLAAIIAYSGSTVAQAAAGAYLVQEAVEETAEAYAGFWALDVVCRPVRIDAELISLNPPGEVWHYSDTGLSDIRLAHLTSEVGSAERSDQLDQATDDAVMAIISALADALKGKAPQRLHKRLLRQRNSPGSGTNSSFTTIAKLIDKHVPSPQSVPDPSFTLHHHPILLSACKRIN